MSFLLQCCPQVQGYCQIYYFFLSIFYSSCLKGERSKFNKSIRSDSETSESFPIILNIERLWLIYKGRAIKWLPLGVLLKPFFKIVLQLLRTYSCIYFLFTSECPRKKLRHRVFLRKNKECTKKIIIKGPYSL